MKKTILVLLSVLMVAAMVLTLAACNECARNGHTWGAWGPSEVEGKEQRECSVCHQKEYRDVTAPGGHVCQDVCEQCGKCTTDCEEPECTDKCKGHGSVEEPCKHESADFTAAVEGDCLHAGKVAYWYCEECDKYFADTQGKPGEEIDEEDITLTIDPTAHKYSEWKQAVVPDNCSEDGKLAHYECTVCNKNFNEQYQEIADIVVPAHHTYTELKQASKGADCQTYGTVAHYECEKCDKWFANDEAKTELPEGEARKGELGNHVVDWESLQQAVKGTDCQTQGTIAHYQCSKCDQYFDAERHEIDSIAGGPLGDHKLGGQVQEKEASCDEAGHVAYYQCETCLTYFEDDGAEQVIDDVVIPAGHKLGALIGATTGADCQTHGAVAHYECEKCNKWFADEQAATELTGEARKGALGNHIFDQQMPAIPATCGTAGEIAHNHCQACGKWYNTEGQEIQSWVDPATGLHTFTGDWTQVDGETHRRKCANCSEYEEKAHTWGTTAVEFDTDWHKVKCTADGCNATKELAHEWQYSSIVLEKHTKSCQVKGCNETVTEDHYFGEGAYGSETRHNCECGEKVCGETTNDKDVTYKHATSNDHVPLNEVTVNILDDITFVLTTSNGSSAPQYNKGGYIQFYGGNYLTFTWLNVKITKIELVMTETGYAGAISVVSGGGTYSLSGTKGTWIAGDNSETLSLVLQNGTSSSQRQARIQEIKVYYSETVATGTHNWVEERQEATCTENGSITNTCKRCGKVEVETIQAQGHVFGDNSFHQEQKATCEAEGVHAYWQCETCGKKFASNDDKFVTDEMTEEQLRIEQRQHNFEGQDYVSDGAGKHYQVCAYEDCDGHSESVNCDTEIFVNTDESEHWHVCSACGYEHNDKTTHSYEDGQCECGRKQQAIVVTASGVEDIPTFTTLKAAVEWAQNQSVQVTITLNNDLRGEGIKVSSKNANIIIDLNGHTYTVQDPAVGSVGTQTSGFQFLKGNSIEFRNGTINIDPESQTIYRLIQNYANLKLDRVTLDGTNIKYGATAYTIATNFGTTELVNSKIVARSVNDGALAIGYGWSTTYLAGVTLNVDASSLFVVNVSDTTNTALVLIEIDSKYAANSAYNIANVKASFACQQSELKLQVIGASCEDITVTFAQARQLAHVYGVQWTTKDEAEHQHPCLICGSMETEEHTLVRENVNNDYKHRVYCEKCDYNALEDHVFAGDDCVCGEPLCYENTKNGTGTATFTAAGSGVGTANTGVAEKSVTFTDGKYTFTLTLKKGANNNPALSGEEIRVYKDCTLTITAPAGIKITKVVFTASSASYASLGTNGGADSGSISTSGTSVTWTNDNGVDTVTFTNSHSDSTQFRFKSFVVTYSYTETETRGHHVWDEGVEHEPTCTEDGYTLFTCIRCNATDRKAGESAIGHNGELVVRKDATCTEAGYEQYYRCTNDGCGKLFKDQACKQAIDEPIEIPASGHSYRESDWHSDIYGHWHECDTCQQQIEESKLSHNEGEYDTSDTEHWAICTKCGWASSDKQGHSYDEENDDKCVCGKINPAKHSHVWDTELSGDETGHWYACTNGDCQDRNDFVPHNWESITAYTYESTDKEHHWKYCDDCLVENKNTMEQHAFNSYNSNDDDTHTATCGTCYAKVELEHDLYYEQEDDQYHYVGCHDCMYEYYLEHNFTSYTPNDNGKHDAYCETCQATVEQEHTYPSGECVCGEKEPAKTKYFVKVMNATTVTAGKYLIVYEDGNVILDASSTTKETKKENITIITDNGNKKIEATEDIMKSCFSISSEVVSGSTRWYIASTSLASTYYLGQNSNANGSTWSTTKNYNTTISVSSGDATIISSGGAYLRYNSTNSPTLFRFYKSSSYSSQKAVQLYLLEE